MPRIMMQIVPLLAEAVAGPEDIGREAESFAVGGFGWEVPDTY
jgi:hypothetical protein